MFSRIRRSALVGLAMVVGLLFPTIDARAALVRMRPEARLTKPLIRLGDIAEVAAESPAEQARLEGLAIAPAPAAGRTLRLEFAEVRSRLEALGVDLAGTEFSGASMTVVTTPGADQAAPPSPRTPASKSPLPPVPVPEQTPKPPPQVTDQQARRLEVVFADEVERQLASRSPPIRDVDVEVQLDLASLDTLAGLATSLIAGTGAITVTPSTGAQLLLVEGPPEAGMPHIFVFHCRGPKGDSCSVQLACRVTPWPRVVQLKGTVARGAILRAEDLIERPVTPDRHDPETQPSGAKELIGRETTRLLRGGETIRREDVREVTLVRRGELVTVHSRRAGISVRVEARSLDEGSVGQSVTVVTLDGKTKYVARVVGYHEVEVGGVVKTVSKAVATSPNNLPVN